MQNSRVCCLPAQHQDRPPASHREQGTPYLGARAAEAINGAAAELLQAQRARRQRHIPQFDGGPRLHLGVQGTVEAGLTRDRVPDLLRVRDLPHRVDDRAANPLKRIETVARERVHAGFYLGSRIRGEEQPKVLKLKKKREKRHPPNESGCDLIFFDTLPGRKTILTPSSPHTGFLIRAPHQDECDISRLNISTLPSSSIRKRVE